MQTSDRFGEERSGGNYIDLSVWCSRSQPKRWNGVGDNEPVDCRIGNDLGGPCHEQPVGDQSYNPLGTGPARSLRSTE